MLCSHSTNKVMAGEWQVQSQRGLHSETLYLKNLPNSHPTNRKHGWSHGPAVKSTFFVEDPSSGPSTHIKTFGECNIFFWSPRALHRCGAHTHVQAKCPYI